MKLKSFSVQNYRCINDSGVIEISDLLTIVGKNESGKSALLQALANFNKGIKPNIDVDWPRGRRESRDPKSVFITTDFVLSLDKSQKLKEICRDAGQVDSILMQRNYDGEYLYFFKPTGFLDKYSEEELLGAITDKLAVVPEKLGTEIVKKYAEYVESFLTALSTITQATQLSNKYIEFKKKVASIMPQQAPQNTIGVEFSTKLFQALDPIITDFSISPKDKAIRLVSGWVPSFILMDEQKIFSGSVQLKTLKDRRDKKQLSPSDETVLFIFEMAGINLDQEIQKIDVDDKTHRMHDLKDASKRLTKNISGHWSQKKYEIEFQADGQHFVTFIKEPQNGQELIKLEERSKGFQWFFSFDMTLMQKTNGTFKNSIILLDEPGLHLHAMAQKDLLERFKEYTKNNQIIHTTHLPFMIDFRRLDNIIIADEEAGKGVVFKKEWGLASEDARFTVQSALGLSWSQTPFIGYYNLVVEGVDDLWTLSAFSELFDNAGQPGLDKDITITPAGGASKVAYICTILFGQKLKVAALLDSDNAGDQARDQLVKNWILENDYVLRLGDILGVKPFAMEDLFEESYYLSFVKSAYAKELAERPLTLDSATKGKMIMVDRVEDAFKKLGIELFNKGRVAKRIMKELRDKTLTDINPSTVERARKIIDSINAIVARWKTHKK